MAAWPVDLQPSDDLARIFSWQETRLVSKSLTLNYKRVLYLDRFENKPASPPRVCVSELLRLGS